MLDKVRARLDAARSARREPQRDNRGRFISKSNGKTAAANLRRTFVLGQDRIQLDTVDPVERLALDAVKRQGEVARRNKLAMAGALYATRTHVFEGVKQGRTRAQKHRDAHQRRKAAVAARSAWASRIG